MARWLVTGATDGIGFETALGLARAGHDVVVHGRSREKARAAVARLVAALPTGRAEPAWGDYQWLDEVRELARQLHAGGDFGGVVHNAGVLNRSRHLTDDGFELTWQVNHVAPCLLQAALDQRLAPGARVVWVSSGLHASGNLRFDDLGGERFWDSTEAYGTSKLANVLTAFYRAGHRAEANFALHPGTVGTKMLRTFGMSGGLSPAEGARTSLFAALDPSLAGRTGLYLASSRVSQPSAAAQDAALQARLWDWTQATLTRFGVER